MKFVVDKMPISPEECPFHVVKRSYNPLSDCFRSFTATEYSVCGFDVTRPCNVKECLGLCLQHTDDIKTKSNDTFASPGSRVYVIYRGSRPAKVFSAIVLATTKDYLIGSTTLSKNLYDKLFLKHCGDYASECLQVVMCPLKDCYSSLGDAQQALVLSNEL